MNLPSPRRAARFLLVAAALASCARARAADPTPVPPLPDFTGPRTLGLSATIGTASGNEGLWVNPGALAARRRYAVDLGGLVDRRGNENVGEVVSGSVVDGLTSPVTTGAGWAKILDGLHEGTVANLAFAGTLGNGLCVGATLKWLRLTGPGKPVNSATVDAGVFWQLADYVSIGAAGYNLVPIGNDLVAPRTAGGGIAIGTDRFAQVTADWTADLSASKTLNRYAAGLELLVAHQFPLRAGYVRDEKLDARWWSVGAGFVQGKVGLDLGYRQGIDDPNARTLSAALRLYFVE